MTKLTQEEHDQVREYDLDMILQDCTYLSHSSMIHDIEAWWKKNGDYLLSLALRDKIEMEGVQAQVEAEMNLDRAQAEQEEE